LTNWRLDETVGLAVNLFCALLLAFLGGFFVGLRALTLTPPALTAWTAHQGWLKVRSPLSWLGTTPAAVVFSLLAAGELVNDKLPKTPDARRRRD
jgi:uncharacterized membrane protein